MRLEKLGPNFHRLTINDRTIWFSYQTPIAFRDFPEKAVYFHSNLWSKTTAGHINQIKREYEGYRFPAYTSEDFEKCFHGVFSFAGMLNGD